MQLPSTDLSDIFQLLVLKGCTLFFLCTEVLDHLVLVLKPEFRNDLVSSFTVLDLFLGDALDLDDSFVEVEEL
jgi:hypothetical protein